MTTEAPVWTSDLRVRLEELLEEYRAALLACVEGLSEQEARLRLVPSKTTLLGLIKHVTYVETVWFDQAVTGTSLASAGVARTPDASFTLRTSDTIDSVVRGYRDRCDASRATLQRLSLDEAVTGRGERVVWALVLQVLRELAHHAGHADILREQIIARRADAG